MGLSLGNLGIRSANDHKTEPGRCFDGQRNRIEEQVDPLVNRERTDVSGQHFIWMLLQIFPAVLNLSRIRFGEGGWNIKEMGAAGFGVDFFHRFRQSGSGSDHRIRPAHAEGFDFGIHIHHPVAQKIFAVGSGVGMFFVNKSTAGFAREKHPEESRFFDPMNHLIIMFFDKLGRGQVDFEIEHQFPERRTDGQLRHPANPGNPVDMEVGNVHLPAKGEGEQIHLVSQIGERL